MLTDIQLNLLSQPISLYPLLAGYTQGVMSTIFGISSHFCAVRILGLIKNLKYSQMIIGFLALIQLEALTLCFGKKHQAIAYILKIHLVHDVLLYFCYFLCIFAPVVLCASMQYLSLSREEQLGYIREVSFLESPATAGYRPAITRNRRLPARYRPLPLTTGPLSPATGPLTPGTAGYRPATACYHN